jgi:hypothetical protein
VNRIFTTICATTCVAGLAGCGDSPTPILDCEPGAGITPDCRFQNPEDLALLPSGRGILVSQFGTMDGSAPGNIARYDSAEGRIDVLFPAGKVIDERAWGDPDCPPPDAVTFAPHGIDLDRRSSGEPVLLVVNHGSRESIEFFEVQESDGATRLAWRGCALGPQDAYFNDVVASSDGGFWVTHMMPKSSQAVSTLLGLVLGRDTGFVYRWQPDVGFRKVSGSDGSMPNGIEKSADETHLFINMYFGGEVRKLDLATGEAVAVAKLASPDNSAWAEDGRLLVASHTDNITEFLRCGDLTEGSCGFAFEIVALDADDLSGFAWLAHRGAPMGGVTVALQVGSELFLGTYAGDRIGRYALERSPTANWATPEPTPRNSP